MYLDVDEVAATIHNATETEDAKATYIPDTNLEEGNHIAKSEAVEPKNAFFECIYVQDATGGITVFDVSDIAVKLGQKVRIEGLLVKIQGIVTNYDGELPGMCSVRIFVGTKWAGKIINVYRYYPEKDEYEIADSNIEVDSEGYMEYKTNHCSDYFIAETSSKLPKTGSMIDLNILIIVGILIMASGIMIISKKKQKNNQ